MKREFPNKIEISAGVDVIYAVSKCFDVKRKDLMSGKRMRSVVDARHAAICLLSVKGVSNVEIANLFKMDRSASLSARKSTKDKYETDPFFASKFNAALAILKGKILSIDIKDARKLAMTCEYGKQAISRPDFMFTNIGDGAAFFLEGYNYALKRLEQC